MAAGLDYLHSKEIVHGDIRGPNILVDKDLRIKISDFGLAFFAGASLASFGWRQEGGAARWLAPELLTSEEDKLPDYACDVFSFGRVCMEVCMHCYDERDLTSFVQNLLDIHPEDTVCGCETRTARGLACHP